MSRLIVPRSAQENNAPKQLTLEESLKLERKQLSNRMEALDKCLDLLQNNKAITEFYETIKRSEIVG